MWNKLLAHWQSILFPTFQKAPRKGNKSPPIETPQEPDSPFAIEPILAKEFSLFEQLSRDVSWA